MKTVKLFGLIVGLVVSMSFSDTVYADEGDDPETLSVLRSKITKYVDNPDLGDHGIREAQATLKFYINSDQEIVVLSTGTDHKYLDSFIKSRLNYQTAGDEEVKPGVYNMKITFKTD